MNVLTDNRRINNLRHTISYGTLERRIRVHVNVILNFQTEHAIMILFLRKSSPVQACRLLPAEFYKNSKHFLNQRGSNSAILQVKKQWVEYVK